MTVNTPAPRDPQHTARPQHTTRATHRPTTHLSTAEHDNMRTIAGPLLLLLSSAAATEIGSDCTAIGKDVRESGAFVACCDTLVLLDVSPPNAEVPVYVCAGQPSGDPTPSGTPTPKPSPSPTPPTGGRCAVYHSTSSPPPTCLICDKAQKRKVCFKQARLASQRGRPHATDFPQVSALSLRWVSRASTPLGASLTVDLEGAVLSPTGEVSSGAIVTIDASLTKKGRFDAWTVFTVGGASAQVHTSCSQPLYVGQLLELGDGAGALVITSVQTDAATISEDAANSTTCTVVAAPPASPPTPPAPISVTEGCFICSEEVNHEAKLSTLTVRPRSLPRTSFATLSQTLSHPLTHTPSPPSPPCPHPSHTLTHLLHLVQMRWVSEATPPASAAISTDLEGITSSPATLVLARGTTQCSHPPA